MDRVCASRVRTETGFLLSKQHSVEIAGMVPTLRVNAAFRENTAPCCSEWWYLGVPP